VAAPQHDGYPGMSWSLGLGLQDFLDSRNLGVWTLNDGL
jgi:hypothetical protein